MKRTKFLAEKSAKGTPPAEFAHIQKAHADGHIDNNDVHTIMPLIERHHKTNFQHMSPDENDTYQKVMEKIDQGTALNNGDREASDVASYSHQDDREADDFEGRTASDKGIKPKNVKR